MKILIAGLILWCAAHLFKRLMPSARAQMGVRGRGIAALALIAALGLIIYGYRAAPYIDVWSPPDFMRYINNLLMLGAFFCFGLSATTGRLRGVLRHGQLTAVMLWALAHLLVNGDLAAIILFGTMLAWAVVQVILINRAEGAYQRPAPGPASKDILLVVITLVSFSAVAGIHAWLGYNPFGS